MVEIKCLTKQSSGLLTAADFLVMFLIGRRNDMFGFLRRKTNPWTRSLDPANLPRDMLVTALFENAILHAQTFARRLQEEGHDVSQDTLIEAANQISEYSLAIMIFYFHAAGKAELQDEVSAKHMDFILSNCGTSDPSLRQQLLDAWHEEIHRKVMWLSLGNNTRDLGNSNFAQNIMSDGGCRLTVLKDNSVQPLVEQFVRDVQASMKHFGIVP